MLVEFAQDMFPGVSSENIGVLPADDHELVVSSAVAEKLQRIEAWLAISPFACV